MMFDFYYDDVVYEKKLDELDSAGFDGYLPPETVKVRYVAGGNKLDIGTEETALKYSKEYHSSFEMKDGDKIDGRLVVSVESSRDIWGTVCFYRVKVE